MMIKILISGGGTGGHVFPAIAIADAIKRRREDADILFVGAQGRLEMEKVPLAGYPIRGLWISGLQRRFTVKNLLFPVKVIWSLLQARRIIRAFRPDVVIGVGGYASGPVLRVAAGRNIPTLIQEQNSYPGITNKILAAKAGVICVAYEGMERFFPKEKLVLTGNPVRQDIKPSQEKREKALQYFGLDRCRTTLLAIGGSLGSRTINNSILNCIENKIQEKGIQVLWQSGRYYYDEIIESSLVKNSRHVKVLPFIDHMDLAYSAADIIISRAGAIAISELCIAGKPSILIPSPNVAEDHQTKNAMALVSREAVLMLKDSEAAEVLYGQVIRLAGDKSLREKLEKNISALAMSDAADHIANEAMKLAEKKMTDEH